MTGGLGLICECGAFLASVGSARDEYAGEWATMFLEVLETAQELRALPFHAQILPHRVLAHQVSVHLSGTRQDDPLTAPALIGRWFLDGVGRGPADCRCRRSTRSYVGLRAPPCSSISDLLAFRMGLRGSGAVWERFGMRLIADGATPASRLVLVDDLETDDGYVFELARPLFLAAGDRISFEEGGLVVARESGELLLPAGDWSTRCWMRRGRHG
ncbi:MULTISPECIES: hypothetical protein [unclassified Streptomyces]|uniref:hypothetical protein n=1 Tax=unclassified Streptomyces TaxID=2593676 RepID=UPI002E2B3975|nr:hypothetical protein [Streptomyces sp. NBC_00223]